MGPDSLQRRAPLPGNQDDHAAAKAGHRPRSDARYSGGAGPGRRSLVEDARLRLGQIARDLPALDDAVRSGNAGLVDKVRAALGWQLAGVRQTLRDATEVGDATADVAALRDALESAEARVADLVVAGGGEADTGAALAERARDIAGRLGLAELPVQLGATGARTARAHGTRGVAQAGVVYLDPAGLTRTDALELLAHEAVHVAQSRLIGEPQPERAEAEAAFLAHELVSTGSLGRPRHPVSSAAAARDGGSALVASSRHPLPWLTETFLCTVLEQSVAGGDLAAAQARADVLRLALEALDPAVRADLRARLERPAPGDHLGALFHGRLSSATRHRLLTALGHAVPRPAASSPAERAGDRAPAATGDREDTWRAILGEASTPVGKLGRVEAPRGLRLHTGPSAGAPTSATLPFDTLVHVERATAHGWYYVVALGDARGGDSVGGTGCVEGLFVELDPPEPTAHLHHVKPGEMLKDIAARYYEGAGGFDWGADARLYVEAIWEANAGTGKLLRVGGELSAGETLFRSDELEKTLSIWKSVQPKHGHAIWIPSAQFIASLKKSGAISGGSISRAAWETAKDAVAAFVELIQYGAGFAVGAIEGVYGAVRDLVMAVPELLGLLPDLVQLLLSGDLIESVRSLGGKLRDLFEQAPELLRQAGSSFADRWTTADDFDRGSFHGEVVGYIVAQLFFLYVTMGGSASLLATGRFAGVVKVIQGLDAASDVRAVAKAIEVPDTIAGTLRRAGGGATRIAGESRDLGLASQLPEPPALQRRIDEVTGVEKGPAYAEAQASLRAFYEDMDVEGQHVHAVSGERRDGKYRWDYRSDAREFSHGLAHVTFKVHLDGNLHGIPAEDLARLETNVRKGVDEYYNFQHSLSGPDGAERRLHLEVEFTDDPAAAHLSVRVRPGDDHAVLNRWYVEGAPATHAHEVGHGAFGLLDEYADPFAPNRAVHTDDSLMGDYWARNPDGTMQVGTDGRHGPTPGTSLKDRHLDEISSLANDTTRSSGVTALLRSIFDRFLTP